MGDKMLHGVLNMPPELWQDTEIDRLLRYRRYREASRRIEDLERKISATEKAARELIDFELSTEFDERVKEYT